MAHDTIWQYARQRGAGTLLGFIGSGPIAVLAGFDLAAALSVSQRPTTGNWHEAGLLLLTFAVVDLLVTLLVIINSQMYGASPADRLTLRPEATISLKVLEEERATQAADYELLIAYHNRVSIGLGLGLATTLTGLASATLSESTGWGARGSAVIVLGSLIVVWLWWREKFTRLFPGEAQVAGTEPDPLDPAAISAIIKPARE